MKNKGFVLVETIVTAVFVLGLFVFIVANIIPLVGDYDRESDYDTIETIYDMHMIRKMILKSDYSKVESLVNLPAEGYFIFENQDICLYLSNENYCKKLLSRNYLDIRKIIVTNYTISDDFVNRSEKFDRAMREYIKVMPRYNNTSLEVSTHDYERRLIVSFNDGRIGNVELLLDGDEEESTSSGSGQVVTPPTSNIVCKPATTLHTATCNRSDSYGCNATGQVGNGNTITYGTLVSGSPKAGDAYDCKVTQDGDYTERFYYVGSEGNNSILIYYTNMNDQTTYAYDSSNQNYHGPGTGYQYLPDTSTWNNPGLIAPGTRSIVAENGNGSTSGGTIESFTYTDKAARFLTYQEVASACGSSGMTNAGYLNNCTWLMENVGQYETSSGSYGYWLETPRSSGTSVVWFVRGSVRSVGDVNAGYTGYYGVRPVITVLTSNISY